MHQFSPQSLLKNLKSVDEATRLQHKESVLEQIRGAAEPDDIARSLEDAQIELTTFDMYNALEVALLSDRDLHTKQEIVNVFGRYAAAISSPLNEGVSEFLLPRVEQYRQLLRMCGLIEDGIQKVQTFAEGEERDQGLAGLQDQVRWGFQQRGIPVEDRSGYPKIEVPGRDFLDPPMPDWFGRR